MSPETEKFIEAARRRVFSTQEKEEHRRSFAYGNTKIENSRITWELVNRQADDLKAAAGASNHTHRD